jgi:hypothetical protein
LQRMPRNSAKNPANFASNSKGFAKQLNFKVTVQALLKLSTANSAQKVNEEQNFAANRKETDANSYKPLNKNTVENETNPILF